MYHKYDSDKHGDQIHFSKVHKILLSFKYTYIRLGFTLFGLALSGITTIIPTIITEKYAYSDTESPQSPLLTYELILAIISNVAGFTYILFSFILHGELWFNVIALKKKFFINSSGNFRWINILDIFILVADMIFNLTLVIVNIVEYNVLYIGIKRRNYDIMLTPYVGNILFLRLIVFILLINYDMKRIFIGIVRSLSKLFWSFMVLFLVIYFFGLVAFFLYGRPDEMLCDNVCEHFTNIYLSFYTMFFIMIGEFPDVAEKMESKVKGSYLFVMFFHTLVSFIILNVLTGIVIDAIQSNSSKRQKKKKKKNRDEEEEDPHDILTAVTDTPKKKTSMISDYPSDDEMEDGVTKNHFDKIANKILDAISFDDPSIKYRPPSQTESHATTLLEKRMDKIEKLLERVLESQNLPTKVDEKKLFGDNDDHDE